MFVSEASKCYTNTGFRWKMLLLAFAGLNALDVSLFRLPQSGPVGAGRYSVCGQVRRRLFDPALVRDRGDGPLDCFFLMKEAILVGRRYSHRR